MRAAEEQIRHLLRETEILKGVKLDATVFWAAKRKLECADLKTEIKCMKHHSHIQHIDNYIHMF